MHHPSPPRRGHRRGRRPHAQTWPLQPHRRRRASAAAVLAAIAVTMLLSGTAVAVVVMSACG